MEKFKLLLYNIYNSIPAITIINLAIGVFVGFYLGSSTIGSTIFSWFSQITIFFLNIFDSITVSPDLTFLSDIAAFESGIVAFLLPLSIEIITKLSERYQSDVITRDFEDNITIKSLPLALVINIVLAIILRFCFAHDSYEELSLIWKILIWASLIFFIIIAFLILNVINRIKNYMRDTNFVLDQLYERGIQSLTNKNRKRQEKFIRSLEGIGDILVFETKRQKNKLVSEGLEKIKNIINRLFEFKNENRDKFEEIALNQNSNKKYKPDEISSYLKSATRAKKNLVGFYSPINQIIRVFKTAIDSQNREISIKAALNLIQILENLASKENNDLFIDNILVQLTEITRIAVENEDETAYFTAISWYIDIVFRSSIQDKDFQLSYLNLFDNFFFQTVQYIISKNQKSVFEKLVKSLIDRIYFLTPSRSVWSFGHILLETNIEIYGDLDKKFQIEKRLKELSTLEKRLNSRADLDSWFVNFEDLKTLVNKYAPDEEKDYLSKLENELRNYITSRYKYNNLVNIMFAIGAYCLFKKRYSYIKYLWEYKQPPDSDSTWIGHEIIPNNLNTTVTFFFSIDNLDYKFHLWEDHHGNRIYFKQYFLLLLMNALRKIPINDRKKFIQEDQIHLSQVPIRELHNLENSIEDLISLSAKFENEHQLFSELGFDNSKIDELINDYLIPLLQNLRELSKKKTEHELITRKISNQKKKEFMRDLVNGMESSSSIRKIFKDYLNSFRDLSSNFELSDKSIKKIGINSIFDKEAFIDDWYIVYGNIGYQYGSGLGLSEDSAIINELSEHCVSGDIEDFDKLLISINNPDKLFILATNHSYWKFFGDNKNVIPKWLNEEKQLDYQEFQGWYEINNSLIPIFEIYTRTKENLILILNKTKMGDLIQHSPLDSLDEEIYQNGYFYINIRSFSDDKKSMKEFLSDPPEWLEKYENRDKKRAYLNTKVLLQIYERIQYKSTNEDQGFIFTLEDIEDIFT